MIKKKQAFSLIELSIVIVLLSLGLTASFVVGDKLLDVKRISITEQRMEEIEQAIAEFVDSNSRLPCPAGPALAFDAAAFGVESVSGNTCGTSGSIETNNDLYYGTVPVVTLGLSTNHMLDGWNRRISYVAYKHATSANDEGMWGSPKDIKGLTLWVDATDIDGNTAFSEGDVITTWRDKSGQGHDLTQSVESQKPTYVLYDDGWSLRPTIKFDGVNDLLNTVFIQTSSYSSTGKRHLFDSGQQVDLFMVMKWNSGLVLYNQALTGENGVSLMGGLSSGGVRFNFPNDRSARLDTDEDMSTDINLVEFRKNSTTQYIRVNDSDSGEVSQANTLSLTNYARSLHIGAGSSGYYAADVNIAEIIQYTASLSDTDRAKIVKYLQRKWGKDTVMQVYTNISPARVHYDPVYRLISHGKNGNGAWSKHGTRISTSSTDDKEDYNISSAAFYQFFFTDIVFVNSLPVKRRGWTETFDDIVRYSGIKEINKRRGF